MAVSAVPAVAGLRQPAEAATVLNVELSMMTLGVPFVIVHAKPARRSMPPNPGICR